MTRPLLAFLILLFVTLPVPASAPGTWTPLPENASVSVFMTGSDLGHLVPRGCHEGRGGALYRPGLGRLLARERPQLATLWLSAGNFSPVPDDAEAVSGPREMFALFAMAGYDAMGVGRHDLEHVPPSELRRLSSSFGVPLVASNLVQLETGGHAFEESVVIERGGQRIGVLSVLEHRPDLAWGDGRSGTLLTVEPAAAVSRAIEHLEGRVDAIVLLSTMNSGSLETLLAGIQGIDVAASGWSSYAKTKADRVGSTDVLWLGDDGLFLGRVSFDASGDAVDTMIASVATPFPIDPLTGRPAADRVRAIDKP